MNILITGGTGLIGSHLTKLLQAEGHIVKYLTRRKNGLNTNVQEYIWDVNKKEIDSQAFQNTDAIIHLAGAGIVDQKWTIQRKQEIISSRTETLDLLHEYLKKTNHQVKVIVSASGIGYYGADRKDELLDENSTAGDDFVAQCCIAWEKSLEKIKDLGLRKVVVRIGIVLSDKGGALPKMTMPVKYFVGAPLGEGTQWVSWIHIDDLCQIFLKSILDIQTEGVYNAVAPEPVTNQVFNQQIAKAIHRPLWLPNVPKWVLKLLMGEMSELITGGVKVENKRIASLGFRYKFQNLTTALKDLL